MGWETLYATKSTGGFGQRDVSPCSPFHSDLWLKVARCYLNALEKDTCLGEVQNDRPQRPEVRDELLGLPAQLVPDRVELGLQLLLEGPAERALHAQLVVGSQRRVQPLQLLNCVVQQCPEISLDPKFDDITRQFYTALDLSDLMKNPQNPIYTRWNQPKIEPISELELNHYPVGVYYGIH